MVSRQHIMGPSGPVEINLAAVFAVMEMLGVRNREKVLRQVKTMYTQFLIEDREKADG